MKDLYLLNYNNYANHIVKKFDNLQDYFPYLLGEVIQNVNFNPGDGLGTTQLINAKYAVEGTPDYLVITDSRSSTIESRWFVLRSTRTRSGQYNLTLKRDTVADSLQDILDADSFITRGYVKPTSPLIYNDEGLRFNQIKKEEILLKDNTEVPWIVAYISPDVAKDHGTITSNIEGYYDVEYNDITDYPYYSYTQQAYTDKETTCIAAPVFLTDGGGGYKISTTIFLYYQGTGSQGLTPIPYSKDRPNGTHYDLQNVLDAWSKLDQYSRHLIADNIDNVVDHSKMNELRAQVGKTIKVGDLFYKISLQETPDQIIETNIPIGSSKDKWISRQFEDWTQYGTPILYTGQKFMPGQLQTRGTTFKLVLTETTAITDTTTFTVDLTNETLSNDETPYGIICMPYSDKYNVWANNNEPEANKLPASSRLKIIQSLGTIDGLLYDIQILPYCPIRNLTFDKDNGYIKTDNIRSVEIRAETTSNYITSMLVAQKSTFDFTIAQDITIDDVKLANETEMWRLSSPNYSTNFEFNPAKFFEGDKTVIRYFNVDCSYKPYSPYIHVAPNFSGLYNKDFNDSRGLICGGDFSIDRISDAWETYQYDNKNYQLQFDRQIQSLELKQGWAEKSAVIGGVNNTLAATGGGLMVGGPVGAAIGAGAGVADAVFNSIETFQTGRDTINAAKDQQKWTLGNIQAQPYGLTKIGALNGNNKIFPFLEHYVSTDEELEILKKYLDFNGMTVMRIGKIADYINHSADKTYIRANIIKFSDKIQENYQYLADIQKEIMGGVYIYD